MNLLKTKGIRSLRKMRRCFCPKNLLFLSLLFFCTTALPFADTIPEAKSDTLFKRDSLADSSFSSSDPVESDSSIIHLPETQAVPSYDIPAPDDILSADTSYPATGLFFGIGAGVSLGNLPLLPLWKNSLPDSLSKFGLDANSFAIPADTSIPDSGQTPDTANLAFTIKEHPSVYNMMFPIRLSMSKIEDNYLVKASLSYAFLSKNHKSVVFVSNDTLNRRIDIKHKIFLHSVSLDINYGIKIPPHYFSIESVEKSYFYVGLGISPLLYLKTGSDIDVQSNDPRMIQAGDSIRLSGKKVNALGTTFTFKTGISAIRRLSSNGIAEITLGYSLNWFDYFYHNGNRMKKSDIDKTVEDKKNLSFLSNRLEIGISFYKLHVKNQRSLGVVKENHEKKKL